MHSLSSVFPLPTPLLQALVIFFVVSGFHKRQGRRLPFGNFGSLLRKHFEDRENKGLATFPDRGMFRFQSTKYTFEFVIRTLINISINHPATVVSGNSVYVCGCISPFWVWLPRASVATGSQSSNPLGSVSQEISADEGNWQTQQVQTFTCEPTLWNVPESFS